MQEFSSYKRLIDQKALSFLRSKEKDIQTISPWGTDALTRLIAFVDKGKTLRGSLVLFTMQAVGKPINDDCVSVGAAIELIHAGLLIHDDIMDLDRLRRKKPALFVQYETLLDKHSKEPLRVGQSLAMCVGDLSYFLAFELLSTVKNYRILEYCVKEFACVAVAQMDDAAPQVLEKLTKEKILRTYRYKTGRYSFSMPMVTGAMLAGGGQSVQKKLEQLGEVMGVLFQLRDDELSVYGNTTRTGKPVDSDRRNRKQTLLSVEPSFARKQKQKCINICEKKIRSLPFSDNNKTTLRQLLTFVSSRDS